MIKGLKWKQENENLIKDGLKKIKKKYENIITDDVKKNKEKMREHIQIPIEWDDTQICKNSKDIKTKYATVIVKQKVDDKIMLSNIVPMPVTQSNEEQEIVHKADIFNVKDLSNGINNIETNMFERPEVPKTPEIIDIILDMSENKIFSNVNGKVISNSI